MSIIKISPQSGISFELKEGQILKVIDPLGEQVADLFCVDKNNLTDALSSGRSIDYNDSLLFTTGSKLYGNSGNIFLEIIEDTCGRHDFWVAPCSLQMFQMLDSHCTYHPSCEENIISSLKRISEKDIPVGTTFNIFMNFQFDLKGRIHLQKPASTAYDFIKLKAHRDLLVALTACSDENTNAGSCKPIHFEICNEI